mmetsp:Transcript_48502/g.135540  ORF Transcript_48502/g.135540 Transcript_48502/m.135540 type:complete len:237 (-) Transcript_48502:598-1308(-)
MSFTRRFATTSKSMRRGRPAASKRPRPSARVSCASSRRCHRSSRPWCAPTSSEGSSPERDTRPLTKPPRSRRRRPSGTRASAHRRGMSWRPLPEGPLSRPYSASSPLSATSCRLSGKGWSVSVLNWRVTCWPRFTWVKRPPCSASVTGMRWATSGPKNRYPSRRSHTCWTTSSTTGRTTRPRYRRLHWRPWTRLCHCARPCVTSSCHWKSPLSAGPWRPPPTAPLRQVSLTKLVHC